jgi:hypothetical protein
MGVFRIESCLRFRACCLLATFLACALAGQAWAQGTTSGSIGGHVADADGLPLSDVIVTVTETSTGVTREALTDANGRYLIPLLRPGEYGVRASLPPRPDAEGQVTLSLGERETVNLELRPIAVEELTVEVAGRPAAVAEGGVIEFVNEDQISNLPVAGRDFTDFISLSGLVSPQPEVGTGGQFSIGGARTAGTNVQIDGADANNQFFGENRGSSRVPFSFSLESIKEFQIITNGYDVEFGKFSGGLINAVTKTGTNDYRGSGFFFWRDEALTKANFDDTPVTDFQSFQFGGVFSGPIIRDKLHFLVSGDFQQRNQPTFALDPGRSGYTEASLASFRNILETVYGFDTDPDFGVFDETDDQATLFGRLDWTISNEHSLSVRANYSDFENVNDRISSNGRSARTVGGTFNDESFSLVGELNSVLSSNIFNTLRLQYSNELRPRPGNSRLPAATVPVERASGGFSDATYGGSFFGILFSNNLEEDKIQITDNLTFQLGDHSLKIGTDNVFTNTFNEFWLNGNGFFDFRNQDDFANRSPSFFLRFVPETPGGGPPTAPIADFSAREYAVYLQDAWRVSPNLLLTAGVRWDYVDLDEAPQLSNHDFVSAASALGGDVTLTPDDTDNFAPRFSFRYDLGADERSVLSGGVGWFTGRFPTVIHSNVFAKTPNALLEVVCFSSNMPEFNYEQWEDNPDLIPANCDGGTGPSGQPEVDVWDADFESPTTIKANLGFDQRLGDRWKVGGQVIFSRTTNNFHVIDRNLQPVQFFNAEGRPVFVSEDDYDPTDEPGTFDRSIDPTLARLWTNVGIGKARRWNFKLDVTGSPLDNLRLAANYALNVAYDNSSFSCCLETEAWEEAVTAGNPNELGDFGDDLTGTWGPSRFERRHVYVLNAIWDIPIGEGAFEGIQISTIYRAQSGNPFTPQVDGDMNGDGRDDNDRAFLPDPGNVTGVQFESPEDLTAYQEIVASESCIADQVGGFATRNSCRNPWWHRVDLRLNVPIRITGTQRLELVGDFFNVLDLFGWEAGAFNFKDNTIFEAEGFDPATGEPIVSVDTGFGRLIPSGFEPFQFQAQLGIRYSF